MAIHVISSCSPTPLLQLNLSFSLGRFLSLNKHPWHPVCSVVWFEQQPSGWAPTAPLSCEMDQTQVTASLSPWRESKMPQPLTDIIYPWECGGEVLVNTHLSLRNHGTATRTVGPQISNSPFWMLLQERGERMLMFKLLGGGKICFQVAAYYKNCWQKANFCLDWNAWVPNVVMMIPAAWWAGRHSGVRNKQTGRVTGSRLKTTSTWAAKP